jgi:hypothetical protein
MCFSQMGVAIVNIMLRDSMMNSCTYMRLRCGFPKMGVAIVGVMLRDSMMRISGKYVVRGISLRKIIQRQVGLSFCKPNIILSRSALEESSPSLLYKGEGVSTF